MAISKKKKQITLMFASIATAIVLLSSIATEAGAAYQYTLLEPIYNQSGAENAAPGFVEYMKTLYTFSFRTSIIVAVMMLVWSGVQITMAFSEKMVGEGKARVSRVFEGLGWIFIVYTILLFVNPDLVKFNLKIEGINTDGINQSGNVGQSTGTTLGAINNVQSTGGGVSGSGNATLPSSSDPLGSHSATLKALQEYSGNKINYTSTGNCTDPNNKNCTSLANLGTNAVKGLVSWADKCGDATLMITAGTEVAGHSTHGPSQNVVDLQYNQGLLQCLKSNGANIVEVKLQNETAEEYRMSDGTVFRKEKNKQNNDYHFHTMFNGSTYPDLKLPNS